VQANVLPAHRYDGSGSIARADVERLGPGWIVRHHGAICGLWTAGVPPVTGERPAFVGLFAAEDAAATREVLDAAAGRAREAGCTLLGGPMDGNTWRTYRFVTWSSGEPPFALEPRNPPQWPDWWRDAGFASWYRYRSSVAESPSTDPRVDRARRHLAADGVELRRVDTEKFTAELTAIHALSCRAFADNPLYTDLPLEAFLEAYLPMRDRVPAELLLVAEDSDGLCGYAFALPDPTRAERDTVIVKTVATEVGRHPGLGAVLVDEVHRRAAAMGLTRVIHALMEDRNRSTGIGRGFRVLRRYELLRRSLVP